MRIKNITTKGFRISYIGNPSSLSPGATSKQELPVALALTEPVQRNLKQGIVDLVLTAAEREVYNSMLAQELGKPITYSQRRRLVAKTGLKVSPSVKQGNESLQPNTEEKTVDPSPWLEFKAAADNIKPADLVIYLRALYQKDIVSGSQVNDSIARYIEENHLDIDLTVEETKVENVQLTDRPKLSPKEQSDALVDAEKEAKEIEVNSTLIDARSDETKAAVTTSLSKMNKVDLMSYAAKAGKAFTPDMTKKALIALIKGN